MSLKTDYYDGATGLTTKMEDAFDAGSTFVTTNLLTLSNALKASAAQGLTKFVVSITTSDNPAYLRGNSGNNLYLKSYLAGVQFGLGGQNVYNYECVLTLNTSDTVDTKIDFNFNFQTA